jgi:hypothetical protein
MWSTIIVRNPPILSGEPSFAERAFLPGSHGLSRARAKFERVSRRFSQRHQGRPNRRPGGSQNQLNVYPQMTVLLDISPGHRRFEIY